MNTEANAVSFGDFTLVKSAVDGRIHIIKWDEPVMSMSVEEFNSLYLVIDLFKMIVEDGND